MTEFTTGVKGIPESYAFWKICSSVRGWTVGVGKKIDLVGVGASEALICTAFVGEIALIEGFGFALLRRTKLTEREAMEMIVSTRMRKFLTIEIVYNKASMDTEFAVKHYKNSIKKKKSVGSQSLTPQQHHDLYVKKYKESLATGIYLSEGDFYEYMVAVKREKEGLVKAVK